MNDECGIMNRLGVLPSSTFLTPYSYSSSSFIIRAALLSGNLNDLAREN